ITMIEMLITTLKNGFDYVNRSWQKVAGTSNTGLQFSVETVGDTIYLLGGRGPDLTAGRNTCFKFKDNIFTPIASLPVPVVSGCSAVVGREIFLIGGSTRVTSGYENKNVYIYDTLTDTWRTGTPCPKNCLV